MYQRIYPGLGIVGCIVLSFLGSQMIRAEDNDEHDEDWENQGPHFGSKCGVYYAPSTIPGAGYGMFAGRDFHELEWVLPGDLVVPIVEMRWHNGDAAYHHLWEEYQWSSRRYDCVAPSENMYE